MKHSVASRVVVTLDAALGGSICLTKRPCPADAPNHSLLNERHWKACPKDLHVVPGAPTTRATARLRALSLTEICYLGDIAK